MKHISILRHNLVRTAMTLVLMVTCTTAWAQNLTISSTSDWNTFSTNVNNGTSYSGQTVYLAADINVTTMVGTSSNRFSGTFDGQGHTLTVGYGTAADSLTAENAAPFRYVDGATINNLHTAGDIYTKAKFGAGIIAQMYGTVTIENCRSSVAIRSRVINSSGNDGTHGGLIAVTNSSSELTIRGCVFDGKLLGPETACCGGFIGWRKGGANIYNSLFDPEEVTVSTSHSATFARNDVDTYNCYFTYLLNDGTNYPPTWYNNIRRNGQQGYTVTTTNHVVIAHTGAATVYDVSGITVYADETGLTYGNTFYAAQSESVSVQIEAGYLTSSSPTVTGATVSMSGSGLWTFAMPAADITVSATCSIDPAHFSDDGDNTYTIHTTTGWNVFCDCLESNNFSGKTVKLAADLPTAAEMAAGTTAVTRMAGSSEHIFRGTFDGQTHTLTIGYGTATDTLTEENAAPFRYVNNATIKNLHTAGDIYTKAKYAAGIVAQSTGGYSFIMNCRSSVVIHSGVVNSDGNDGTHGGLVAVQDAMLEIEGCLFDGKILTTATNGTTRCGGFVGWRNSYTGVSHSLYAPADIANGETEVGAEDTYTFIRRNGTVTNCYYTRPLGTAEGKLRHSITAGDNVTVAFSGTATEYDVSGITSYGKGFKYNNVLYAGNGEKVSLTLTSTPPSGYFLDGYEVNHGTLTGSGDSYTLIMPDDDVVITAIFVTCPKPTNLAASSETAHGATVSWTGYSESYTLQYYDPATAAISGYENGTVTVLSEGFEDGTMPEGWDNTDCTYSADSWEVGTGSGIYGVVNTAANGIYNAYYFSRTPSNYARLITPAMDLAYATEATLTFNYVNPDWDGDYYALTICYRVNGGAWNQLTQYTTAQNEWTGKTVTLTGLGDNYQIAFYVTGYNNEYGYGLGIDDVKVVAEMHTPVYVWNEIENVTSPYTFNTLDPETTYTVRVIGDCGSEGNSQPSNDVSFTTLESCPVPRNLAVTTDNVTATATWTGTEGTCNISINGTVTNNVTSPYTFNVDLSTTYEVMVQANCEDDETSGWSDVYSFTTAPCVGGHTIEYTLNDSYNDGWEGACITVTEGGCGDVVATLTVSSSESPKTGSLTLCGEYYEFVYTQGSYPNEYSWTFTEGGATIFSGSGSSSNNGQVLYTIGTNPMLPTPTDLTTSTPDIHEVALSWTENGTATAWQLCLNGDEGDLVNIPSTAVTLNEGTVTYLLGSLLSDTDYAVKVRSTDGTNESCWSDEINFTTAVACARPTGLAEANITYTTVNLSWTGTSDSYEVQYGPWTQVGTDHITTATLTPYTFDLSDFSGKGTIAIRHYNVTDMYRLNVDDIVVRNADNEIVYSQDFESGSIPSNMSNIDLDGDGYVWIMTSSNINGYYGVTSASWSSQFTMIPDNWLVIPDVQLGGSITFYAVGQDASVPYENFGVFVIADNQFTPAYSGTETSCQLTGLTEGTPYIWRVRGMCDEPSRWVSSIFKTKDDLHVFATNGAWDKISNWTDADGNAVGALPTVSNKVRIDANATIANGVVATAKSVVLNGGSIEIEEGGQLKQGGAVKVTMHKSITGYGAGNEEAADHYYSISTPHACSYLEENDLFPYVLHLTDGAYDLYAFDPTQELEWVNYEYNPDHSEFLTGSNDTGLFSKKGYLYANAEDKDLTYVGTVSSSLNNTLTDTYVYNPASTNPLNGWKLVGNPFSCNAYINYVDGENVLDADFYVMNEEGNGYVLSESIVGLAPLTGAFINYEATGTIQFSSEEPAKGGRNGMLNISLTQGRGKVDQARVRFGQGYNMMHMNFRNNSSKLYITQDGNDYAVVYSEGNVGELPVNFKAEKNGSYTLSFNAENVEFSYLHLIDNLTGNDVDLLSGASTLRQAQGSTTYTFEAKTTDYASRFRLVFATSASTISETGDFAFVNASGNLCIFGIEGEATVQVSDELDHVLSSETFSGNYEHKFNGAPGVYVIRLINGENIRTQKVIVQ